MPLALRNDGVDARPSVERVVGDAVGAMSPPASMAFAAPTKESAARASSSSRFRMMYRSDAKLSYRN